MTLTAQQWGNIVTPDTKVDNKRQRPRLERYVKGVLKALSGDQRILGWDLYNEPSNKGIGERSLPLLKRTFAWAREADPSQPLTCGLWDPQVTSFNEYQLAASDFISFHHYGDVDSLEAWLPRLRALGRPLACTEYLNRNAGSLFATHLAAFKRERIPCFNWGLVSGKTQTIWPWGSPAGADEPKVWFHDIFRRDHTPYDREEVALIRSLTDPDGGR